MNTRKQFVRECCRTTKGNIPCNSMRMVVGCGNLRVDVPRGQEAVVMALRQANSVDVEAGKEEVKRVRRSHAAKRGHSRRKYNNE